MDRAGASGQNDEFTGYRALMEAESQCGNGSVYGYSVYQESGSDHQKIAAAFLSLDGQPHRC
jgi:hypothetical protein